MKNSKFRVICMRGAITIFPKGAMPNLQVPMVQNKQDFFDA